jgi:flagellar P-ring protein precursor FlgI
MVASRVAIAEAIDQKNIVVQVPPEEQSAPGRFISQVLEVQLDPSLVRTEARVVINEKTGTIVMSGDVQLSPVVISHEGLTITTLTPEPEPTPQNPETEEKPFVGLDPGEQGGARLSNLLDAFNKLKIPAEDRIAILKELHRSGKLHARLILED